MGPNSQVSTYPVFYVLHGQHASGQPVVVSPNGATVAAPGTVAPGAAAAAPGAAPAAVAPAAAAAEPAKKSGGGFSKYVNPGTLINSAVQGAVQGGINRAINN